MRSLRRDLLLVQPSPVSLVDSSLTSDLETGRNNRTKVVFHMFFITNLGTNFGNLSISEITARCK